MISTLHLEAFERCPRLPGLMLTTPAPELPVRDAVRKYFSLGVAQILRNQNVTAPVDFLTEAALGYTYPAGAEPYLLAQDYSCWIDGALHLVEELGLEHAIPAPLVGKVETNGWLARGLLHLFLIGQETEGEKWPLLIPQLQWDEIEVHYFPLPSARGGRLLSPLTTLYKHPKLNLLRLAPLDEEKPFGKNWTRVARWEDPAFTWPEWRAGIERDQCLDKVMKTMTTTANLNANAVTADAEAILAAIPLPHPRLRTPCSTCSYRRHCHG